MRTGLKIAIASCGLGHVNRGIEAWANDLAVALHHRGESVTLFKGGGTVERPFERVLRCWPREQSVVKQWWFPTRLAWRWGYGSPYMAEQTTFAKSLIQHLKDNNYDILHVQDPHVALNVQLANLKTRVILAHGTEEPLAFLKNIQYLQHLAPWHHDEARHQGVDKPHWTAIPNFINTAHYAPGRDDDLRNELGISSSTTVFLTVAAIKRHHKRINYLIDEYARVQHPQHYYIFAGGREAETHALVQYGRERLGDRVRFLVNHPRERMPQLYRAADVFVLGSLFEMMPIALVEACSSGLPCITHDHPVMRWMTGPGGVAVDMATSGALAAKLSTDMRELGPLARAHCETHFGTDAVVARILDYYCRVATAA